MPDGSAAGKGKSGGRVGKGKKKKGKQKQSRHEPTQGYRPDRKSIRKRND